MKKIIKSILNLIVDWLFSKKKPRESDSSVRQIGNDKQVKRELADNISDYIDNANDRINRNDNGRMQ